MARRKTQNPFEYFARTWIPALTFVGSCVGIFVLVLYTVPTREYVDKGLESGRRYTDEKTAQTLERAISHSDMNRQTVLLEVKAIGSNVEKVAARQEMILDVIKQQKQ